MKRHRRKHSAEFKARVALEAIKSIKTLSEIARDFEIHPVMVGKWKTDMLDCLPELFEGGTSGKNKDAEKDKEQFHRKLGQLTMEVDFLEKKCRQLGIPVKGRNS